MSDIHSGTAQVTVAGGIPLDPVDGAAHLFVDPVGGDDDNIGLSAAQAFRTIQRAVARANAWLPLGVDADLVIHLANPAFPAATTYAENVKAFLAQTPLRRVFFRADPAEMVVVTAGVAGVGSGVNLIVDAAGAFPVDGFAGIMIRVFDPADPAGTMQTKSIRANTATGIEPVSGFFPVPVAGVWTYEVVRPGVIIAGDPANQEQPTFNLVCPWGGAAFEGENFQNGPSVHLNFIEFQKIALGTTGFPALLIKGGNVVLVGVVVQVTAPNTALDGIDVSRSSVLTGWSIFFPADPIYGTPAFSTLLQDCGVGVRGAGIVNVGIRMSYTIWFGTFVTADGAPAPFITEKSEASIFGGSVIGGIGAFVVDQSAYLGLFSGFFAGLAFLIKGTTNGITARRNAYLDLGSGGVAFRALGADAIRAQTAAFVDIQGPPFAQTVGADIPGNAVDAATSANVRADPSIFSPLGNFESTGVNCAVDDGTMAAWGVAGAALILLAAQSGARIYKV